MANELESRIDDLYALPLERFTPERDALAKELAADGDRAGAARVKALRKPVVAAWAVNALALVAKYPEQVRILVAHEPPAAAALPDRDAALATCPTASANRGASATIRVPDGGCSAGKSSAGSSRREPSYAAQRIRACD